MYHADNWNRSVGKYIGGSGKDSDDGSSITGGDMLVQ